jgi:hypothetical protein
MIDKLFESLDEKVFTTDLKESLTESFNEAVELKAIELTEIKLAEKVVELEEKAKETEAVLEAKYAEKEAAILEQVDLYMDKIVEEFVTEAKESLALNLVNEKADLMVEAFDAMLVAGGVEVQKIVEAKEESDIETKLAESIAKYDELIEANIKLEKTNDKLVKMGVIMEMKEGLSIVEAEKFAKLAELVDFSKDDKYAAKLETLKESVKGSKIETKIDETVITESVIAPAAYAHLM